MRPITTRNQRFFSRSVGWFFSFLLGLELTTSLGHPVNAQTPQPIPPEIQGLVTQLETAANQKDLQSVMQLYSSDFSNTDGLNYATLSEGLKNLWADFSQINYQTQIESWQRQGNTTIVETLTTIEGTKNKNGQIFTLDSSLRSRQYIEQQKIVRQEILTEQTIVKSGENPPNIEIKLPEKVKVGQKFDFDVIVQEPLGDDLLLGAALEQPINNTMYLKPANFELELLPAGGIFKLATAPSNPENRWLSAILIRSDGMVVVTQRVLVEK